MVFLDFSSSMLGTKKTWKTTMTKSTEPRISKGKKDLMMISFVNLKSLPPAFAKMSKILEIPWYSAVKRTSEDKYLSSFNFRVLLYRYTKMKNTTLAAIPNTICKTMISHRTGPKKKSPDQRQ